MLNSTVEALPEEERRLACIDHIRGRKKGALGREILKYLPKPSARPKYCSTVVVLDHYKFTYGLETYLSERSESYRHKGLHWWKDSYKFIEHMKYHDVSTCKIYEYISKYICIQATTLQCIFQFL